MTLNQKPCESFDLYGEHAYHTEILEGLEVNVCALCGNMAL